jgi:hypothetical protein
VPSASYHLRRTYEPRVHAVRLRVPAATAPTRLGGQRRAHRLSTATMIDKYAVVVVDPGYILATGAALRCYHSKMAPFRMTASCWCAMGDRGGREETIRMQKDLEKADAEGMRPGRT